MAKKSEMYRWYARECLRLAAPMPAGDSSKAFLLKMAEEWHRMAQNQERAEQAEAAETDS